MGVNALSENQQEALLVVAQVCATFSLCGSLFVLACYEALPHLRKLSFTLVAWLAFSDIGADVTYYMRDSSGGDVCMFQAAVQQFFQVAQILWTVAIACVLHDVTVNLRMYHPHEQSKLMRRFHMAIWSTSLVTMLLPFTTDSYGPTGAWCWIKASDNKEFDVGTMWRYLLLYIPLWLAIVFNIRVYVNIFRVINRFSVSVDHTVTGGPSAEQQQRMRKFVNRLFWYPAVLIASWTFATINRIQNAVNPDNPNFGLFFLHTSLVTLQGFFNAMVYGSTDAIKNSIKQAPIVERVLRRWRRPGRGSGSGSGSGDQGADPEDESEPSGISMGVRGVKYNEMMDDSLGIGDEVENDLPGTSWNLDATPRVSDRGQSDPTTERV